MMGMRYDLPLFVPATKPERIPKALSTPADAIVIDLEDAVSAPDKAQARDALANQSTLLDRAEKPVFVRVNARATDWYAEDVRLCADLPLAGVILPKAETNDDLVALRDALGSERPRLALIETVAGLAAIRQIAQAASRLVFGSIDFCADLGCDHDRTILLPIRQELVLSSRLAALPAPIDGVTTSISDADCIRDDTQHSVALGFGGKLLIHPAQIQPARAGMAPTTNQVAWAQRVLDASRGEAVALDGEMIDAPVLARAKSILARNYT